MIDEKIMQQYENEIKSAQIQAQKSQLDSMQQDVVMQNEDKGMISEQLDVSDILDNMYYLLKGFVLKRDPKSGTMSWQPPENNDMVILSDYGVNYILGAVQWYVNKNTLLSNYEDEIIFQKMEDFATTLADNVFMDYDNMFCYPTLEDCQDEIKRRIQKKVEIKMFAEKLAGIKERTEAEIRKEILKEMETRIEHELIVIKEQKLKMKLKRFESIIRFVQDTVHSAYNRAWNGAERRTLREHIHITESKGGFGMPMQQQFTANPMKLFNAGGRK